MYVGSNWQLGWRSVTACVPEYLEAIPRIEVFSPTRSSSRNSSHQAVVSAFLPSLLSVSYVRAHPETRFICISSKGINARDIRAGQGSKTHPGSQSRPATGSSESCHRRAGSTKPTGGEGGRVGSWEAWFVQICTPAPIS